MCHKRMLCTMMSHANVWQVSEEVEYQLGRVAHQASIAVFGGNIEVSKPLQVQGSDRPCQAGTSAAHLHTSHTGVRQAAADAAAAAAAQCGTCTSAELPSILR